jgi:hypothetical protein
MVLQKTAPSLEDRDQFDQRLRGRPHRHHDPLEPLWQRPGAHVGEPDLEQCTALVRDGPLESSVLGQGSSHRVNEGLAPGDFGQGGPAVGQQQPAVAGFRCDRLEDVVRRHLEQDLVETGLELAARRGDLEPHRSLRSRRGEHG